MKKIIESLQDEGQAKLQALLAIQRLYKWMDENYPASAAVAKTTIIRDCIREVHVEGAGHSPS